MADRTLLIAQMTSDGLVEIHPWDTTILIGKPPNQIMHSRGILDVWSEAQLNAVGIYHVEQVEPPPGYIVTGYHFEMQDGKVVQVLETQAIPPPPLAPLSRRQFFQVAAMMGLITHDEALAAVQHGTIPAVLDNFVNQIEDPDQKFAAQMLIAGASEFERHHPLTEQFGGYLNLSAEQLDHMWQLGGQL